jgi:hypothetical protein
MGEPMSPDHQLGTVMFPNRSAYEFIHSAPAYL